MVEFVYLVKADALNAGNSGIRKVNVQNLWESKTRPHLQHDYLDLRPLLQEHLFLQVEDHHRRQAPYNEPGATTNRRREGVSTI